MANGGGPKYRRLKAFTNVHHLRMKKKHKYLLCVFVIAVVILVGIVHYLEDSVKNKILTPYGLLPVREFVHFKSYQWMDNSTEYNFKYRQIAGHIECPKNLLVVIASAPGNFKKRNAIRQTWANDLPSSSRLLFVLGTSLEHAVDVKYELDSHNDMIQFDFKDAYVNATIKTVMSLKFASVCSSRTKYMVKVDDDTYVNVHRLDRSLQTAAELLEKPFIAGQVRDNHQPHRWFSKWIVSYEEYPENDYPPYTSGNLYVISASLLPSLHATAVHTRPLHLEDVFTTGMVATKLGIPRVALEGIRDQKRLTVPYCAFDNILSAHYITPFAMKEIHEQRHFYYESCLRVFGISWCSCVPKVRTVYE